MKQPSYIDNGSSVGFIFTGDGTLYTISTKDIKYPLMQKLRAAKDWDGLYDLMKGLENYVAKNMAKNIKGKNISLDENGNVLYHGKVLEGFASEKLKQMFVQGEDFQPLFNFLDRLVENVSSRSIEQLFKFCQYKMLPITPEGMLLAYKGVNADGWSCHGNLGTIVKHGKTNEKGQIFNKVGDYVEVERNQVDDDANRGCSHGLHVGSFDYAKGFGGDLLLVEVDPKDAVSVPNDCSWQKLRCCKYNVIRKISFEVKKSVAADTSCDKSLQVEVVQSIDTVMEDVLDDILDDLYIAGVHSTSIKNLQAKLAEQDILANAKEVINKAIDLGYYKEGDQIVVGG